MKSNDTYQEIDFLLKELFITKKKYDYKYEKAEQFNIFKTLYKWNDEVKLHSRFLSVLLNPKASHKKGSIFLDLFLKKNNIDLGERKSIDVFPDEQDKKEYKKIDILAINRIENKALIIENKIFAPDSNNEDSGQLERYCDRLHDEDRIPYKNLYVIYLSLDGRLPTKESLGKYFNSNKIKIITLSYGQNILNWLNECLKEVYDFPFLRESIIQYKKLVSIMTQNDSDIEHRLEIREVISKSDDNLKAAKQLFDNYKHIKWHTVFDFWRELEIELERKSYIILDKPSEETITNITHFELYKKGQKGKQECQLIFEIEPEFKMHVGHTPEEWLYFGSFPSDIGDNKRKTKISEIVDREFNYYANEYWAFYKYLFETDEERIDLSDFHHEGTFNLIKKDSREKSIMKICSEIDGFIEIVKKA